MITETKQNENLLTILKEVEEQGSMIRNCAKGANYKLILPNYSLEILKYRTSNIPEKFEIIEKQNDGQVMIYRGKKDELKEVLVNNGKMSNISNYTKPVYEQITMFPLGFTPPKPKEKERFSQIITYLSQVLQE